MKVVPLSLLLSLLVHSIEGQGPISRVRCRRPSGSQGAVIVQGCKKRTCTRVTSRRQEGRLGGGSVYVRIKQ